jgi:hypothetical protein
MSKFPKSTLCTGVLFLLYLASQTTASAAPIILNPKFMEVGNDVVVTFDVEDENASAFANLPQRFIVRLFEDDLPIFGGDEILGTTGLTLDQNNTTQTLGGGYKTTFTLTITFRNASNAATGLGNDYLLTLEPIPEPGTLLLLGMGLTGFAIKTRKKWKIRA